MELKPKYTQTEVGLIPEDWEVKKLRPTETFIDAMRRSGFEEEWEVRRLDDIADIVMGQSPSSSNYNLKGDGLPLIQGNADIVDRKTIKRFFTTQITKRGKEGDILMSVRAPVGEISRALFDVCLGRGVCAIRFPNDFLYHYLIFIEPAWVKHSKGSTFDSVNSTDIKAVEVKIPSDPREQTAIAAVLGDVDDLLDALDRLIAKKRDLKQAAMQQFLTGKTRLPGFKQEWKLKQIRQFASLTAGGTPSTLIPEFWNGSIPWMNSGELHQKHVNEVDGSISEYGLLNSSAKLLPTNCVLVGLAGQGRTRGTVAMNLFPLCTNQSIAAILPNPKFVPEYLYHNLDSRYTELRDLSSGGGGRGGLNLTIIGSIMIPFPSISEQRAIATILSDIDAEITALEARRKKTQDLKRAMMQELLTGKTRLITLGGSNA